jgi:hypothetical protein
MHEFEQIEHPDRVAWYQSLIQEWASQIPGVEQRCAGEVVAWVGPYTSQAGMRHPEPTGVIAASVEAALEGLANTLYADYQQDVVQLRFLSLGVIAPYVGGR